MTDMPAESEETLRKWERRAPGWRLRCLKCGFSEPFGKYGVRLYAASYKKCVPGRCARCRRLGCMAASAIPGGPNITIG